MTCHGPVRGVQPGPTGANEVPAARTFIERLPRKALLKPLDELFRAKVTFGRDLMEIPSRV